MGVDEGAGRGLRLSAEGGRFHEVDRGPIVERLKRLVETARTTGELKRSEPARGVWREVYPRLSEGRPGGRPAEIWVAT
jgi:hypothetical protein